MPGNPAESGHNPFSFLLFFIVFFIIGGSFHPRPGLPDLVVYPGKELRSIVSGPGYTWYGNTQEMPGCGRVVIFILNERLIIDVTSFRRKMTGRKN
jgi:hypothetical protein